MRKMAATIISENAAKKILLDVFSSSRIGLLAGKPEHEVDPILEGPLGLAYFRAAECLDERAISNACHDLADALDTTSVRIMTHIHPHLTNAITTQKNALIKAAAGVVEAPSGHGASHDDMEEPGTSCNRKGICDEAIEAACSRNGISDPEKIEALKESPDLIIIYNGALIVQNYHEILGKEEEGMPQATASLVADMTEAKNRFIGHVQKVTGFDPDLAQTFVARTIQEMGAGISVAPLHELLAEVAPSFAGTHTSAPNSGATERKEGDISKQRE